MATLPRRLGWCHRRMIMAMTHHLANHNQEKTQPVLHHRPEYLATTALQGMSDLYLDSLGRNGSLSDATKRAYRTDLRQSMEYAGDLGIEEPAQVKGHHTRPPSLPSHRHDGGPGPRS